MKNAKFLLLSTLALTVSVLVSCGDDDTGDANPTERELVIEALTSGDWNVDTENTMLNNIAIDMSTIGISFTEDAFTLSGEISPYVSGGTYQLRENGSVDAITVDIESEELQLKEGSANMEVTNDNSQVRISFETEEAEGRVDGLGVYELVFTKD